MSHVPVHNHSEYSTLDGLSTVREIAERCACLGCSAVGITDHGVVSGHLEFGKELKKFGIKPIYGVELYHGQVAGKPKGEKGRPARDQAHFVVGAKTNEGLKNLWRLVDSAATNFHFVGRATWDMLEKYKEGLFATSACIQGLVSQGVKNDDYTALNRYLEIFRTDFFIELHTYPTPDQWAMNLHLARIAQERGIPVVYATDAHFATKEQYEYHDAYVAMQTGQSIDTPLGERKMWHPNCLYIQDEAEIRESLKHLPDRVVDEALSNSCAIGDMVSAELPEIRRHLPAFIPKDCPWVSEEESLKPAAELFIDLVEQGLVARYGANAPEEVWNRAEREMEVFLRSNLEHYFLQAWDFCQMCDDQVIPRGPGRGSSAGSIIAYALGITDVEPLQYGLIFERFFNPGREKGFPDIDSDFPKRHRKTVRDYLKKRWGAENVRTIGTITRLKPKAVCDKTYKPCGILWDEKEAVKKIIDGVPDIDILGTDSIGWSSDTDPGKTVYVMDHVGPDIAKYITAQPKSRQDILWRWIDFCDVLCSRVSGYGVHPSGVVVADTALNAELPCYWSASQEELATQFPMDQVDARMFVKQDLLGLRTLDTLEAWEEFSGEHPVWSGLEHQPHPEGLWELLDQGLTLGIFQIEDGYAKRLCKQFKPRSIEDLAVIVALNRPGPIRSGAPDSFIARRVGAEAVSYDHPMLEELLEPTYGWFLYQEQVIAFFSKLGYDLGDADAVRKILGKKKPEEMAALRNGTGEWEGKGYGLLAQRAGLDPQTADLIWAKIEDFAKYSFNKSHAVAYATLAFRTLYAKIQNSGAKTMALIKTNPDMAGDYVAEARRMGLPVLAPDVLKADAEISMNSGEIYFGFANIKGLTKKSATYLVEELREVYDVSTPDLMRAALDRESQNWEQRRDFAKANGEVFTEKSPKQQFRSNQIDAMEAAGAFENYQPRSLTMQQRQKLEMEYFGVILTDNTDDAFNNNGDLLEKCGEYADLEEDDAVVCLAGVITALKEVKTKAAGRKMGIVTIEYEGDSVEFAVFPNDWERYNFLWRDRTPGIFTLARSDRGINFRQGKKLS